MSSVPYLENALVSASDHVCASGEVPIHVLAVSNHWAAQKNGTPTAGIFVERQLESLRQAGVQISTFDVGTNHGPFRLLRKWWELRCQVRQTKPDIIHAQYGTIVSLVAALAGRPLIISYCGSDLLPGADVSALRRYAGFLLSNLAALRAHGVICKSDQLRGALWWRRNRAVVVPNGVDLAAFSPGSQESARRELGLHPSHPIVLFLAQSDPVRKGLDLAQAAFRMAQSRVPDAELHVISNVDPRRMPLYYRAADVLLCASRSEGSPNMVKEALACNLPVVSTPVGDVQERLAGVHPSAVVPRDPITLGKALASILTRRERSNGRMKIASLGHDCVAQKVLNVYRAVLAARMA